MLTNKEKKELRTQGQTLSALVQIGKGGLNENILQQTDIQLEAHELVKVALQKSADISVREAAIECAAATGSDVVHIIGRTFLLYRPGKDK